MPESPPETEIAALLRRAGYDLPPVQISGIDQGHALLRAMLARLGRVTPEAEPATIFRPVAPR